MKKCDQNNILRIFLVFINYCIGFIFIFFDVLLVLFGATAANKFIGNGPNMGSGAIGAKCSVVFLLEFHNSVQALNWQTQEVKNTSGLVLGTEFFS